jgi:hypothetical protein
VMMAGEGSTCQRRHVCARYHGGWRRQMVRAAVPMLARRAAGKRRLGMAAVVSVTAVQTERHGGRVATLVPGRPRWARAGAVTPAVLEPASLAEEKDENDEGGARHARN